MCFKENIIKIQLKCKIVSIKEEEEVVVQFISTLYT